MGVGGQRHAPGDLPPERPSTHFISDRVVHKIRSVQERKFSPPIKIRITDRPARSESLFRLSYSGPPQDLVLNLTISVK